MLVAINTEYRYHKERDKNKLSSNWQIRDLSHDESEEHLLKGYPITNIYTTGVKGFRRKAKHFTSASFVPLDFDNDPEKLLKYNAKEFFIEELTAGHTDRSNFIKENGYIGYLTYNHTTENNRFRIIFKLPEPIKDLNEYIKIYKAFLKIFPSADHDYVIPTGYIWGAKEDTSSLKLGSELSFEVLNGILEKSNPVESIKEESSIETLPGRENPLDDLVSVFVQKQLSCLINAKYHSRMIILNKVCFSIGGLGLRQKDEEFIKAEIKKIAYELGSKTNFRSLTKKNIDIAINKSFEEGRKKPWKLDKTQESNFRLFRNLPKPEYYQIPQHILTDYPSPEYINGILSEKINDAEYTQTANFGKFSINNDDIFNKTLIIDIFDILKNTEAFKYYLAVWEYANLKETLHFNEIEINKIIKLVYPDLSKQEMYRQRMKFKNYIRKLFTITLFRITKIKNTELEEGMHLMEKLSFFNKGNRTYMSCILPETFGKFGSYLPSNLNKLTGNEKGATNLVIALYKEAYRINGFEPLKKDKLDFSPPENLKPIKWSKERVFKEVRTITTINVTERSRLLKNTLIKLKEINIIDRFTIQRTQIEIYLKK
jgi:hypothetical protein